MAHLNYAVCSATTLLFLFSPHGQSTVLRGCFPSSGNYDTQYSQALSPAENAKGNVVNTDAHLVGNGSAIYAQCNCPGTLSATTQIKGYSFASSPLRAGSTEGTGYLTEKLDINIDAYTDAINSPDGSGLYLNSVSTYPTLTPTSKTEPLSSTENQQTVCNDDTRPVADTPQRQFKWSVIAARLYVKSPILGQEIIPSTLVEQTSACLYFNGGGCTVGDASPVGNVWFSGVLSAPLSCTINAGSVIEVDLGSVARTDFIASAQPPQGYALKNVDISFHCDNAAVSNAGKIKLTLSADQGLADAPGGYIARMAGRDDIGVRMYDNTSASVHLDGSSEFPITLDDQGNGTIRMTAAPVATTQSKPEPGKFEGNVTVNLDIR